MTHTIPTTPQQNLTPHPDSASSWLIQGDNLPILQSLQDRWAQSIRLIYLDPPYNTGQHFQHYDDDFDQAQWLSFMEERLLLLRPLLAPDGVLVAQIDHNEQAHLKVLLDQVFGRRAFINTIAVRMSATSGFKIRHTAKTIVKNTEFLHIYAQNLHLRTRIYEENLGYDDHYAYLLVPLQPQPGPDDWRFQKLIDVPEVARLLAHHGLPPHDHNLIPLYARSEDFRAWVIANAAHICRSHTPPPGARQEFADGLLLPDGLPPIPDPFGAFPDARVSFRVYADHTYWLRRSRVGIEQLIPLSIKLRPIDVLNAPDRLTLTNILGDWWDGFHLDMGNVETEGGVAFKNGKKPERLLRRLLSMFTEPNDWVLDPFAGSGTTGASAHKMHRRWLMIERGPQCISHIIPRLSSIISGQDMSGITRATAWSGGGHFHFVDSPAAETANEPSQ